MRQHSIIAICLLLLIVTELFATTVCARPLSLEAVAHAPSLESRSPIALSPNGSLAAIVYQRPFEHSVHAVGYSESGVPTSEGAGQRLILVTAVRGTSSFQIPATSLANSSAWGPSWSRDGSYLAFYSDVGGDAGLWVLDVRKRTAHRIGSFIVRPHFATDLPTWIDDDHLVVKALPPGETISNANGNGNSAEFSCMGRCGYFGAHRSSREPVTVLKNDDAGSTEASDSSTADLVIVELSTGKTHVLVSHEVIRGYAPSPNHNRIAYSVFLGERDWQLAYDLTVFDVQTWRKTKSISVLSNGYGHEFAWDPQGDRLAMITSTKDGSDAVTLWDGKSTRRVSRRLGHGVGSQILLWSADGGSIYLIRTGELLRIDGHNGSVSSIGLDSGWRLTQLLDTANGSVYALATRDNGSWCAQILISPSGSVAENWRLPHRNISQNAARAHGVLAFESEDLNHPAELWIYTSAGSLPTQLTRLNTDLESGFSKTVIVQWINGGGQHLRGILLLPPGDVAKSPVVFVVYGGADTASNVNRFGAGWGDSPAFNMDVLTSRGYAVFFPDMPIHIGNAANDFTDAINGAADALVQRGFIDPNRMAIMGQSFGSYAVWSILTRSRRFKAAITSGNILEPDLASNYLALDPGGTDRTGYFDKGQGDMGGPPWQFPDRYIKNSPIWRLNAIGTPLLMGQGDRDGSLRAPEQMFVAFRRLRVPIEYRIYHGEDHVIQSALNVVDWWQARLTFLSRYIGQRARDQAPRSLPPPLQSPR